MSSTPPLGSWHANVRGPARGGCGYGTSRKLISPLEHAITAVRHIRGALHGQYSPSCGLRHRHSTERLLCAVNSFMGLDLSPPSTCAMTGISRASERAAHSGRGYELCNGALITARKEVRRPLPVQGGTQLLLCVFDLLTKLMDEGSNWNNRSQPQAFDSTDVLYVKGCFAVAQVCDSVMVCGFTMSRPDMPHGRAAVRDRASASAFHESRIDIKVRRRAMEVCSIWIGQDEYCTASR